MGQRITEILKQPQYEPLKIENQVMIFYIAINGYIEGIPVDKVRDFEKGFYRFMEANHPEVGKKIKEEGQISGETESSLKTAIEEYKKGF